MLTSPLSHQPDLLIKSRVDLSCFQQTLTLLLLIHLCYGFLDSILHTLVVTTYLSHCFFSYLKAVFPFNLLASNINQRILSTQMWLMNIVFLSGLFSVNQREMGLCEHLSRSAVYELSPDRLSKKQNPFSFPF